MNKFPILFIPSTGKNEEMNLYTKNVYIYIFYQNFTFMYISA